METFNNHVTLSGQIAKIYPLRYTLSRLPVVSFVLEHNSRQIEAGMPLDTKCRLYCVALDLIDEVGNDLLNSSIEIQGFLACNSRSQLVLHAKQITFLDKGN